MYYIYSAFTVEIYSAATTPFLLFLEMYLNFETNLDLYIIILVVTVVPLLCFSLIILLFDGVSFNIIHFPSIHHNPLIYN